MDWMLKTENGDPVNFVDPTGRTLKPFQQVAFDRNIREARASGSSTVDLLAGTGIGIPGTVSMEAVNNAQIAAGISAAALAGGIAVGVLSSEITVASGLTGTMTTTVAEHVGMPMIAAVVAGGIAAKGTLDIAGTATISSYVWAQTSAGQAALTRTAIGLFATGYVSDQAGWDTTGLAGLSAVDFGTYASVVNTATSIIDLGAATSKMGTMIGDSIVRGQYAVDPRQSSKMSLAEYMAYSQQQKVSQDPTGKYVKP